MCTCKIYANGSQPHDRTCPNHDLPITNGPYGNADDHAVITERDQFHAAIYGHAASTCATCDAVRAAGTLAANGHRPMIPPSKSPYRPVKRTRRAHKAA